MGRKMTYRSILLPLLAAVFLFFITLAVFQPSPVVRAESPPTAVVTTGRLNVRDGPGIGYTVIAVLSESDVVELLSRNADSSWVRVRLKTGLVGWCGTRYLDPSAPFSTLPVTAAVEPWAYVTTGALNVRSGPDVAYKVIHVLHLGDGVGLMGRNAVGSWVKVRIPGHIHGWVRSLYISPSVPISSLPVVDEGALPPPPSPSPSPSPEPTTPPPTEPPPTPKPNEGTAVVTAGRLNVRDGPGIQHNIITVISFGDKVTLIGRNYNFSWAKVRLANGIVGWVSTRYITIIVPPTDLPVLDK